MASISAKNDRTQKVIEGMAYWASYYRANIDVFIEDYLGITFLKDFQKISLVMMNRSRNYVWIAARGLGKTYLTALFSVVRCILYPGTKVVIASGNRGQAINVLEKVRTELMEQSPTLANEINLRESRFSGQEAKIMFKNGSNMKVVTAGDSARGNRANILVVDEFRLVKKDTIDTILKKFLTSRRMPPYRELTTDEAAREYALEPNMTCYLSSAYYKESWAYAKTVDTFKMMLDDTKRDFAVGLPYQLPVQEGLLFREDIEDEMSDSGFSEIKFVMELGAEWFGEGEGSFFDYDSIAKNRRIQYPMLPDYLSCKLNSPNIKIKHKAQGEIRILSIDIALMASTKHSNDASAIFINQMLPTRAGRYTNNIVFCDSYEGLHTEDQTLIVRKMFDEFECDYLVIDAQGIGLGCYDMLVRDIVDRDTGEVYPALSCCNNPDMAARCTVPNAPKVIYAIKASAPFNSDCALLLREGFRSGRIRLLVNEYDGEELISGLKGYGNLTPEMRIKLQMPYVHTTLLINELVKLEHEESSGRIKLYERPGMRKDRFSSLAYNYYVATELERKSMRRNSQTVDINNVFTVRPPRQFDRKKKGGGLFG